MPTAPLKIKWKVQEAPTGRYRSFFKRGWPVAEYDDGYIAARIECTVGYHPVIVTSGDHPVLTLYIADYSKKPWKWVTVQRRMKTLQEAKDALVSLLEKYPHLTPFHEGGPYNETFPAGSTDRGGAKKT